MGTLEVSGILNLVFADSRGNVVIDDDVHALARSGTALVEPDMDDFIPMPAGADLVLMPDRYPVGIDTDDGGVVVPDEFKGKRTTALAALLPVGYTRTLAPAFERDDGASLLPLFGYTAVAAMDGRLYAAAALTDDPETWHPSLYNLPELEDRIRAREGEFPGNRIIRQLAKCSREYHCHTAQNIFYGRWEAGIPVSRSCNADCLGCISLQPAECCPSPQGRIDFTPTVEEVVDVAVGHLESAGNAIISFGQGCEGDPLTQGGLLAESIRGIRKRTGKGTININTNAGMAESLQGLIDAGLDTIRVSIISPFPEEYAAYHRPRNYGFGDVLDSLGRCSRAGVKISLNLLTFPGFTDNADRLESICGIINRYGVDLVQMRNLNIDPDLLGECFGEYDSRPGIGIRQAMDVLRSKTGARIGSFSRPLA